MTPIANERPSECPVCGRPHGKSVLTANNGRMYTKMSKVIGDNPATGRYEPHEVSYWHNIKGEPMYPAGHRMFRDPTPKQIREGLAEGKEQKDIRGTEYKLKVESEYVHLTEIKRGNQSVWRCTYCRGDLLKLIAASDRKAPTDGMDPLFDNLADIDAAGKALREKRKQEKRDRNIPIVGQYMGDVE
jgi:hypothetical protein